MVRGTTRGMNEHVPDLPRARGELSARVIARLRGRAPDAALGTVRPEEDPLVDDDLQLALYLCYEIHYRSYQGVVHDAEWSPSVLVDRRALERVFLQRLHDEYRRPRPRRDTLAEQLAQLVRDHRQPSLSAYMLDRSTAAQFKELAIHRSAYQLKEADPHTWAIPRLAGDAKAALIRIQMDEYGHGVAPELHAHCFAAALDEMGLDSRYGAYLDHLPGSTLATVNLMSMFGLHRVWRGALVGNLAVLEMCSVVPMSRYASVASRLGFSGATRHFYDLHVSADADHEQVALEQLAGSLARDEPFLHDDILFGARATLGLEAGFAARLQRAWDEGGSSLRVGSEAPPDNRCAA